MSRSLSPAFTVRQPPNPASSAFRATAMARKARRSPGLRFARYRSSALVFTASRVRSPAFTGISGSQGPTPTADLPTTAGVLGSSDAQAGVIGTSNRTAGVLGFSNNVGVFGAGTNFAGVFRGNVLVTGTLTASVKNAMVAFPDGSQRVLHCMESPEHWFEDFGTAKLKDGRMVVKLDADFAKVIERDYRVFLTPEGDCRGLYVRHKSAASFDVCELMGGKSSIAFSYRIIGRRKDIRGHRRFAKVDTRLPAPAPRKPKAASRSSALRSFVAGLEKEARARAPKGAKKALRPFPKHLMREAVIAAKARAR
jgi:hypothetical protein